ncbi:MAG: hypothetical protein IE931_10410 [Sphingobacteriales bacterium]|nr:hypothetical protein [Sphingobacteriales bacterium]
MNNLKPVITFNYFYESQYNLEDSLKLLWPYGLNDLIEFLIWFKNSLNSKSELKILEHFKKRLPNWKAKNFERILKEGFDFTNELALARFLIELIKKYPNDSITPKRSMDESDFDDIVFDLILIFNSEQYEINKDQIDNNSNESIWAIALTQSFTGLNEIDFVRTVLPKYLILISFIKNFLKSKFKILENEILEKTTAENLYTLGISLMQLFSNTNTKVSSFQFIEKNEIYEFFKRMDMIIDFENLPNPNFNLNDYINKPFYKNSSGDFILLNRSDFAFALEKRFPHFLLEETSLRLLVKNIDKTYRDSFFSKLFFEKYLMGTIFKDLEKPGFRVLEGEDSILTDHTIIYNEKNIFLLECKTTTVHYNDIYYQNIEGFKSTLDKNFCSEKKGVSQLVKTIERILLNADDTYKLKTDFSKITIYPIIIYSDSKLIMHGVNDYLNSQFEEFCKEKRFPFKEIKPLVMINYSFFLENHKLIKTNRRILKESIDHYLKFLRNKKSVFYKKNDSYDYFSSMTPFETYVVGYKKLYMLNQSEILKEMIGVFNLKEETKAA